MESPFPLFGSFWLPAHPEHEVHGSVSLGDDGIQLEVAGTLQPPAQHGGVSPRWVTIPVIHGRLHDGQEVTLLQASGYDMTGTSEDVTEEYQADFALDGGHVTGDCFTRMRIVLDSLMPWVSPPGIVHENLADGTFTVDPGQTVIAEAALTDGRSGFSQALTTSAARPARTSTNGVPLRSRAARHRSPTSSARGPGRYRTCSSCASADPSAAGDAGQPPRPPAGPARAEATVRRRPAARPQEHASQVRGRLQRSHSAHLR